MSAICPHSIDCCHHYNIEMSDPLSLIREATISNTPIQYDDRCYIIGTRKFSETTKTFFKRTLQKSKLTLSSLIQLFYRNLCGFFYYFLSADDYFYTIRDVIFFLENCEESLAEYRKKAVEARISGVVAQDQLALKNYLTGVIETCAQIDVVAMGNYQRSAASELNRDEFEAAATTLSLEKMNEQRQLHAQMLDKTIQKSRGTVLQNKTLDNM